MGRVVREHGTRRSEILNAAQPLFYQTGYEQTAVQNILEAIGIAKGTFLLQRETGTAGGDGRTDCDADDPVVEAIVADKELNAREKLNQFFSQVGPWKLERKPRLLPVVRAFIWMRILCYATP